MSVHKTSDRLSLPSSPRIVSTQPPSPQVQTRTRSVHFATNESYRNNIAPNQPIMSPFNRSGSNANHHSNGPATTVTTTTTTTTYHPGARNHNLTATRSNRRTSSPGLMDKIRSGGSNTRALENRNSPAVASPSSMSSVSSLSDTHRPKRGIGSILSSHRNSGVSAQNTTVAPVEEPKRRSLFGSNRDHDRHDSGYNDMNNPSYNNGAPVSQPSSIKRKALFGSNHNNGPTPHNSTAPVVNNGNSMAPPPKPKGKWYFSGGRHEHDPTWNETPVQTYQPRTGDKMGGWWSKKTAKTEQERMEGQMRMNGETMQPRRHY